MRWLYGVADVPRAKKEAISVKRVVEKPARPTSNLAIMPLYIFNQTIFEALRATKRGNGGDQAVRLAARELE